MSLNCSLVLENRKTKVIMEGNGLTLLYFFTHVKKVSKIIFSYIQSLRTDTKSYVFRLHFHYRYSEICGV